MDTAKVELDLIGRLVWFWPASRNHSPVQGRVTHVWPMMGAISGVNLDCPTCDNPTSVPHESSVEGATGFFWSFTKKSAGMPNERAIV